MNDNLELAFLLNVLNNPANAAEWGMDPAINWTLFYKLVHRHRVWHQIYQAFKDNAFECSILTALSEYCQRDNQQLLITASETIRIARAFTAQTIEHCFVKGTLLNVHIYGGLNTRPCRDIDVLVNAAIYPTAIGVLFALGYQKKLPGYELTGFKERWYLGHRHDMAFYHPEKKRLVELHFCLSYLGLDFFPLRTLPLVPIRLFNVPVLAPEDDFHVLYLMIHGAIHAWIRLRWLQDIALFIKNNQCDLMHVYDLAKQINCQHIVEQSLILVSHLFLPNHSTLIPFIQKPSRKATQLANIAQAFITADYESIDGIRNIRMFLKYRVYLAKLAVRGKKMHAVWGDLFKLDELFSYVTFPDKLSFMYYVLYPLWVIKYVFRCFIKTTAV